MTPDQMALVHRSLCELQPVAALAAQRFYTRLFELDPGLRPLFRGELVNQGGKWMAMLVLAVGLLEDPSKLDAMLQRLGQRHAGYGVQPRHYDTVGRALLDTLAGLLGAGFTPALRAAWAALYAQVARTMCEAAAAMPPRPAVVAA